jgi:hypothetical protein
MRKVITSLEQFMVLYDTVVTNVAVTVVPFDSRYGLSTPSERPIVDHKDKKVDIHCKVIRYRHGQNAQTSHKDLKCDVLPSLGQKCDDVSTRVSGRRGICYCYLNTYTSSREYHSPSSLHPHSIVSNFLWVH